VRVERLVFEEIGNFVEDVVGVLDVASIEPVRFGRVVGGETAKGVDGVSFEVEADVREEAGAVVELVRLAAEVGLLSVR
jgi:hypothetical protein